MDLVYIPSHVSSLMKDKAIYIKKAGLDEVDDYNIPINPKPQTVRCSIQRRSLFVRGSDSETIDRRTVYVLPYKGVIEGSTIDGHIITDVKEVKNPFGKIVYTEAMI